MPSTDCLSNRIYTKWRRMQWNSDTLKLAQLTLRALSGVRAVKGEIEKRDLSKQRLAKLNVSCLQERYATVGWALGGHEIYAVCVHGAWCGSLIKHNLRFNAFVFGSAKNRSHARTTVVVHRSSFRSPCVLRSFDCACHSITWFFSTVGDLH